MCFCVTQVRAKRSALPQVLLKFILFCTVLGIAEVQLPKADPASKECSCLYRNRRLFSACESDVALFSLLPFQIHLASGERRTAELCARWSPGSFCFWRGDLALIFVTDGVDSLSTERGGKKAPVFDRPQTPGASGGRRLRCAAVKVDLKLPRLEGRGCCTLE